MYGFDLEQYKRLREARERRRREVEQDAGWSDSPPRAIPRFNRVHEFLQPDLPTS